MRATRSITVMIVLVLVTACSLPRIKLFTDTDDPLREYTLEGSGSERILLISVQGTISDAPQKGLVRSTPSLVQQIVSQLKKAEKDDAVKEAKILAGLADDARLVVYRRAKYSDDNYYNFTGAALEDELVPVVNIALPESLNLHAGFYYLWPGAITAE